MSIKEKLAGIFLDLGLIYGMVNVLLFSEVGGIVFQVNVLAAILVFLMRCVCVFMPDREGRFFQLIYDVRTTLRVMGFAMLCVVVFLAYDQMTTPNADWGMESFIVPFFAGLCFAVVDFRFAAGVGQAVDGVDDRMDKGHYLIRVLALGVKRPELYLALGWGCQGTMANMGPSMFAFVFVVVGYILGMRNILKEYPECYQHPKFYYALAGAVFCIAGFIEGNYGAGVANGLAAFASVLYEHRITPGGLKLRKT